MAYMANAVHACQARFKANCFMGILSIGSSSPPLLPVINEVWRRHDLRMHRFCALMSSKSLMDTPSRYTK